MEYAQIIGCFVAENAVAVMYKRNLNEFDLGRGHALKIGLKKDLNSYLKEREVGLSKKFEEAEEWDRIPITEVVNIPARIAS